MQRSFGSAEDLADQRALKATNHTGGVRKEIRENERYFEGGVDGRVQFEALRHSLGYMLQIGAGRALQDSWSFGFISAL